jgi:hypothetical protein
MTLPIIAQEETVQELLSFRKMALVVSKESLPGYKTAKYLYDLLPGSGTIKKVIVGATVGAVIVGAIAAGCVGVAALLTWAAGSVLGSALVTAGILAALPMLYQFIAASIQVIYNFNWNQTDTQLDEIIDNQMKNLYGVLGEAAGQAVGQFIGGLAGKAVYLVNPAAARVVTEGLSEERKDEVYSNMAAIHMASSQLLASVAWTKGFKSARRWLKKPDSPFYGMLKSIFGENFTKWGDEGQPSFTFSNYVEEKIETIPDEAWRNFTENFVEGLMEGLTGTLQQTSNAIRNYMVANAIMQRHSLNPQTLVARIKFDRNEVAP